MPNVLEQNIQCLKNLNTDVTATFLIHYFQEKRQHVFLQKITAKQKTARKKNIAIARKHKKKGTGRPKKKVLKGSKRKSGMSARMEHELHRFTTMSDKQLTRRLGKIKNPKKLSAFIKMASWTGKRKLGSMAKAKLSSL